jgi:hypothetical protein
LKKLDFLKIRSIGARDNDAHDASSRCAMRWRAAARRPRVNLSFTIQPIVHHSERMAAPESGKFARPAEPITGGSPALAFA